LQALAPAQATSAEAAVANVATAKTAAAVAIIVRLFIVLSPGLGRPTLVDAAVKTCSLFESSERLNA
jgi:hypothetical protein